MDDCLLLKITDELHIIRTSNILTATSIMHECSTYVRLYRLQTLPQEREKQLQLTHMHTNMTTTIDII